MSDILRVDGKRVVSMPTAVLLTVLAATATAALAWGNFQSELKTTATAVSEQATRLKSVETKVEEIREMKNDITWIKRTMEEDRRRAR